MWIQTFPSFFLQYLHIIYNVRLQEYSRLSRLIFPRVMSIYNSLIFPLLYIIRNLTLSLVQKEKQQHTPRLLLWDAQYLHDVQHRGRISRLDNRMVEGALCTVIWALVERVVLNEPRVSSSILLSLTQRHSLIRVMCNRVSIRATKGNSLSL